MFGRLDQMVLREVIDNWPEIKAMLADYTKRRDDPMARIAGAHAKVPKDAATDAGKVKS